MVAIIQDVLFPIMSFTDSDQELWETDPHEYIRLKFGNIFLYKMKKEKKVTRILILDIFEDYATPVPAAQSLLHSCCKKRKGILPKTMQVIMQVCESVLKLVKYYYFFFKVITSPNADDKQKDGALHMIGTLADVLLKKKLYRDQLESMLTSYVFPEFNNSHGNFF